MTDQRVLKPYDVEVLVAAGRDRVWDAVTQPAVLHEWFGWDYDGLDAEIRHIFVDEATLWAPERMGWADGSFLEVTGDDDRSRVRAVREGAGPADPGRYDAIEEGWRAFLIQLRFLMERRPTGRRRTLFLTGRTTGRHVLGLADGGWERLGSRVAWTTDGAGDLVVVAGHLRLDDPAAGRMEVTVSTFGLDAGAFDDRREAWSKRWAPLADGAQVVTAGEPSPSGD
ncbi:activator of HSP90 ATPase [Micromonosporaceae bacterium Da 78-11]